MEKILVVDDDPDFLLISCVWITRGKCLKDYVKACPTNAINFDQKEEIVELDVGSIIVATGFEMFDPTRLSAYSYGKSPNIIDGLKFEHLSSATGPTKGEMLTAEGKFIGVGSLARKRPSGCSWYAISPNRCARSARLTGSANARARRSSNCSACHRERFMRSHALSVVEGNPQANRGDCFVATLRLRCAPLRVAPRNDNPSSHEE